MLLGKTIMGANGQISHPAFQKVAVCVSGGRSEESVRRYYYQVQIVGLRSLARACCSRLEVNLVDFFVAFFVPLPSENAQCFESNVQVNTMSSTMLPKATINVIIHFFILIFSIQLYFEARRKSVFNGSTHTVCFRTSE